MANAYIPPGAIENEEFDPNEDAEKVEIVSGGGGGGGATTVADGADITQGSEADTAVTGDNPGTVSAKLRGINKSLSGPLETQELDNAPTALTITAADSASTSVTNTQTNQVVITGTPTTNSVAQFAVNGDSTYVVEISGTWTGTLVFEKAISTTQFTTTSVRVSGGFSQNFSSITGASTPATCHLNVHGNEAGIALVRVRATALTSGTVNLKLLSGAGIETVEGSVAIQGTYNTSAPTLVPGQRSELQVDGSARLLVNQAPTSGTTDSVAINDGNNTVNTVVGDTGFNGMAIAAGTRTIPFTTSSAGAQTLLANTMSEGYTTAFIIFSSVGVGLVYSVPSSSASGGSYTTLNSTYVLNTNSNVTGSWGTSVNTSYQFPIVNNYIQINITALTSGNVAGIIVLTNAPRIGVTQLGTWNLTTTTNTTTGDTATVTGTTTFGAGQSNTLYRGAIITAILGTVTGTSPTLTMQLQWSPDSGTTWLNYGPSTGAISVATGNTVTLAVYPTNMSTGGATPAAFTLGSTGSELLNAPLPKTWRMTYLGAGTTPSIPLASVQVNYLS